jgi:ABC-2 type transport system ATP-binding protein
MENLTFAARVYGLDVPTARRTAATILNRLRVGGDRVDRPIEQMSRGMQQKVAIARALLTSPVLLLLDEPTTGLDPRSKVDVQEFIEEIRAAHDTTIVLTTHDLDEAERLCDDITIIDGGRIVTTETPAGLVATASARLGRQATLWDVFMAYTGRSLDDDLIDDGSEARS